MGSLKGRVALVAGATRGAGRGIATALGEAGATVWCTGRSSAAGPPVDPRRPETIEETAARVDAAGGRGIPVRVDHTDEEQVAALARRIEAEHGGLDLLVNDIWGGEDLMEFGIPVWSISIDKARAMFDRAVFTHLVNIRHLTKLLVGRERPLVVEITDGDTFGYRGSFVYDLVKMTVIRMAWNLSVELRPHGITAVSLTPGFLRSEAMLDLFGVTEANWQEAEEKHFAACSETPLYVGRAVAALAADPGVAARSGRVFSSWGLAREFGFTDADGRRPMWDEYFGKAFACTYPAAGEAAFEPWREGPFELARGDGYPIAE